MTRSATYQPGSATPIGYFSIEGAAGYASVSTQTVKRWIQAGLPVYQGTARRKVLIRAVDIESYLTRRQAPHVDLDALVADVLSALRPEAAYPRTASRPSEVTKRKRPR